MLYAVGESKLANVGHFRSLVEQGCGMLELCSLSPAHFHHQVRHDEDSF
jgi:hypothetical protein